MPSPPPPMMPPPACGLNYGETPAPGYEAYVCKAAAAYCIGWLSLANRAPAMMPCAAFFSFLVALYLRS